MDELTAERFLLGVPYVERYRKPGPLRRRAPVVDWAVIEERRRVLDQGLHPAVHTNVHRETSRETSDGGEVEP